MPSCWHTRSKASYRTNLRFFKSFFLLSMAMSMRLLLALSCNRSIEKLESWTLCVWTRLLKGSLWIDPAHKDSSTLQRSVSLTISCSVEISDCYYTAHIFVKCGGVHRKSCSTYMSRTREVGRKWRERCTHTWQCCGCSQRACHLTNHRRRSQDVDWSITLTLLLFTHLVIFLQMFLVVSDPCSQSSNWAGKWKEGVSGLTAMNRVFI